MNNNISNDNYENENVETNEVEEVIETNTDETRNEQQNNSSSNHNVQNEFREKMIKMFVIVVIGLIIFLAIGFIISLVTKKHYTYASLEDEMKNAAIAYFKDNKSKLPKNDTEIVEIDATILANNKYMKTLDKYIKNEKCTGKVMVEKVNNNSYSYTPYLSCNDGKYITTKLYEKIIKNDNIVTEGFGVYYMNNEYVYRGTDIDNYVRFSDSEKLWRIVKVTSNNEVVLIYNNKTKNRFPWDERYNNEKEDTTGINLYKNSTISSLLEKVYDSSINDDETLYYNEEEEILTKEDRKKVVEFDSCVGTRSMNDTSRNGSSECSVLEKTKISLLSAYDYLNASLDANCNSTTKQDCQNYNYLASDYIYWLANGPKEDSSKVYQIVGGYIFPKKASLKAYARVVIHLKDNVMLEKGKGTQEDPYIIR